MSLADEAIEEIRELIRSGTMPPGSKLPPEPDLAAQLGLSRNLAREAVKALAVARVLEGRISEAGLAEVKRHLDAMREARDDVEQPGAHDAAFHRAVVAATGNESLVTLLDGVSGRTLRARVWRGLVDSRAAGRTLAEHEPIFTALSGRDTALSQAAALLHVSSTEQRLRAHLNEAP
ncbi:FadR/GntR family transcriptional regulator [Streptomyces acidicola]|uniref:FadR/GntR family transcriptional regulator n=1 Tax=Streptomyces acidicola TaxID=2596892 RepID=UPI003442BB3B